jgi:threonyl-tRNA synthetase
MEYVDSSNQLVTPYIIHRTSLGCYERTLALLIEKYAGAFPLWLAPEQIRILPIGDEHVEYAARVQEKLAAAGLRVELDDSSNTIGYKIRATQMQKVPYMLIIGAKEVEEGTVSVRNRAGETVAKSVDTFLAEALLEVAQKKR